MARRISLPGSDELFGDRTPYAGRSAESEAAAGSRPGPSPSSSRRPASAKPAAPKRGASKPSPPQPVARKPASARTVAPKPAGPKRGAPKPAAPKPAAPRRAPSPEAQRRSDVAVRIDGVEAGLRSLPIDTLLELRDELEALLIDGAVTEADLERILGPAEA